MKKDIREFSDRELVNIVFNDVLLYNIRHECHIFYCIDSMFTYTDNQMSMLVDELSRDYGDIYE